MFAVFLFVAVIIFIDVQIVLYLLSGSLFEFPFGAVTNHRFHALKQYQLLSSVLKLRSLKWVSLGQNPHVHRLYLFLEG